MWELLLQCAQHLGSIKTPSGESFPQAWQDGGQGHGVGVGDEACMLCFYHRRRMEEKKREKRGGGGGSYAVRAGVCDDDGAATAAAMVSSTSMAVVGLVWVSTVWVDSRNAPGTGWAWMKVAVNMCPAGISSIVMPCKGLVHVVCAQTCRCK